MYRPVLRCTVRALRCDRYVRVYNTALHYLGSENDPIHRCVGA
jgi:hypothetical protein